MSRLTRMDIGGETYHVLNRANTNMHIFETDEDYKLFENILEEAVTKFDVKLYAYTIMPDHFHLVVRTNQDGDLSHFMGWLQNTHTRRWHATRGEVSGGHLYQGRYKSFICQNDEHFLHLVSYIERKAKKLSLCKAAENWKWSSLYRREKGAKNKSKILSSWPIVMPEDYITHVNKANNPREEEKIEKAITKSSPYGDIEWSVTVAKKFGLEQTLRGVGRPKREEIKVVKVIEEPAEIVTKISAENREPEAKVSTQKVDSKLNEQKNTKKGWFTKIAGRFGI